MKILDAIAIIKNHMEYVEGKHGGFWASSPSSMADMFQELGILTIEEVQEPNQIFFSAMGEVNMNHRDVGMILQTINNCGLKLVEK